MTDKTICFGFNANFRLVEATGDMATVIAWQDYQGPACGLRLTRSDLHEMLDAWLDEKAGYCERFGHFCGVGHIAVESAGELGTIHVTDLGDIPLFGAHPDYWTVEMEHG